MNAIAKILAFSQVFAENNFGKGDAGVKKFTLRNGLTTKCYKYSDGLLLTYMYFYTFPSTFQQIEPSIHSFVIGIGGSSKMKDLCNLK